VTLFTIGFTRKSAEDFFSRLQTAGVQRVIDIRLNNTSQLAGFAKASDLKYFLRAICGIEYIHEPLLAPTQEILDAYKKSKGSWGDYELAFNALMDEREITEKIPIDILGGGCLLCSEDSPQECHRRLVAERLQDRWKEIEIKHL
jgi:uncharacterized protein (DUF488 family)